MMLNTQPTGFNIHFINGEVVVGQEKKDVYYANSSNSNNGSGIERRIIFDSNNIIGITRDCYFHQGVNDNIYNSCNQMIGIGDDIYDTVLAYIRASSSNGNTCDVTGLCNMRQAKY